MRLGEQIFCFCILEYLYRISRYLLNLVPAVTCPYVHAVIYNSINSCCAIVMVITTA